MSHIKYVYISLAVHLIKEIFLLGVDIIEGDIALHILVEFLQ